MKSFTHMIDVDPIRRKEEHAGIGEILFRRLWTADDFKAPVDFLDYTVIPPGSSIGIHRHDQTEEIYFIASGAPLVQVNSDSRRLARGDISVVRSGQCHQLLNDTSEDVEILVIQVRVPAKGEA